MSNFYSCGKQNYKWTKDWSETKYRKKKTEASVCASHLDHFYLYFIIFNALFSL